MIKYIVTDNHPCYKAGLIIQKKQDNIYHLLGSKNEIFLNTGSSIIGQWLINGWINEIDMSNQSALNISDLGNNSLVMATYRFPNGNVVTFGYDDQQIPELQGVYSDVLKDKIKQHSDSRTLWNGF